jgi:lipoprotein-anchoring transpeptidase ErfK/SrfK
MNNQKINSEASIFVKKDKRFLFGAKSLKLFLCAVLIMVSSLALYYMAKAGTNEYLNIYAIDAQLGSDKEIDPESEVKIFFNQPIVFFGSENIQIIPVTSTILNLSEDGKILTLKNGSFAPESKYKIILKDIRGISGMLLKDKELVFYTKTLKSEKILKTSLDKKNYFAELSLSEDKYVPPPVSIPKNEIIIEPKFTEGKYIDISISNQVMTIFEDGRKINSFLVSTGKYGMPTPLGTFSVKRKEPNHWSSTYGLWMPFSMNFYGAYYIHELPYWPSGYREGENHLGIRVSHGCVRLGIGPAKYVFDWAEVGIPVYVHN